MRKTLREILGNENLRHSSYNALLLYGAFKSADIVSNLFGFHELNAYNSLEHLATGGFVGTWAYRMAGGGSKGVLWGLGAATFGNCWELIEPFIPKYNNETPIDTLSDIVVVYFGSTLGFYLEGFKPKRRNKTSRP